MNRKARVAGDPGELAEQAADRVKYVHLKDVDQDLASRLATRQLGFKKAAQRGAFRPPGHHGARRAARRRR